MQNANKKEKRTKRAEKKIAAAVGKLAKKPQAKRAIKRIEALSSVENWESRHHTDEYKYALGLFDPKSGICKRIPNPLPVPSATATQQGILTLNASATGYLALYLNPWISGNMICWSNGAGINDTSALVLPNSAPNVASIMSTTNAQGFRVVSAWLGVSDMTPALTKTGIISSGSMSVKTVASGLATADTIRDSYWVSSVPNVTLNKYVGGVYFPMDAGSTFFTTANNYDYQVPVVFASALSPNAAVSVQYVVNYEYIPAPGQSDLLSVTVGAVGNLERAMTKIGELKSLKKDFSSVNTQGFGKDLFPKIAAGIGALGGVASTVMSVLSKI